MHECNQCSETFLLLSEFNNHKRRVHYNRFSIKFNDGDSFSIQPPYPLQCPRCLNDFESPLQLKAHARSCSTFQCFYCEESKRTRADLKQHAAQFHHDQATQCQKCQEIYFTKLEFSQHVSSCFSDVEMSMFLQESLEEVLDSNRAIYEKEFSSPIQTADISREVNSSTAVNKSLDVDCQSNSPTADTNQNGDDFSLQDVVDFLEKSDIGDVDIRSEIFSEVNDKPAKSKSPSSIPKHGIKKLPVSSTPSEATRASQSFKTPAKSMKYPQKTPGRGVKTLPGSKTTPYGTGSTSPEKRSMGIKTPASSTTLFSDAPESLRKSRRFISEFFYPDGEKIYIASGEDYRCPRCCTNFENDECLLQSHMNICPYPKIQFNCLSCDILFNDKATLKRHNAQIHRGEYIFSFFNEETFSRQKNLEYFDCIRCGKLFPDCSKLKCHIPKCTIVPSKESRERNSQTPLDRPIRKNTVNSPSSDTNSTPAPQKSKKSSSKKSSKRRSSKSPMSKSQDSNKEQAKIALMQWVKQNVSLGEDQVQNSAVSETMSEKSLKKQFTTSKKPKSSSKVKGKSPAVEPTNFDADFDVSMDFPNDHSDLCWSDTTTPSVQRKQRNMLKRGKNREMEIDSDYVCSPTFSEIDRNQITPNRRRSFTGSSTQSESTSGDYHLRRSSRRSTSGRSSTVSSPTHSNQNCCDDCGDACSSAIVLEYHRLLVHLKMILTKFSDTAFLVFPNDPNSSVICVQCLEEVKSINLESHLHSCQYNYLEDELEKYWDNRLQNAQSSGRNENDSQGMLQYVDDFLPRKLFSVQGRLYQCNYCTEVFLHISKKSKHEQELHTEELDRSKPQTENITTDTLPNPSDSNSKQKIGPKANECNSKPKVTPKFTPKSKVGHRARAAPTIFYKGDAQTTAKLISNMVVKQITSTLKSFLLKIENSLNPLLSRRKNRFAKIKNPKHFTRRSQNAQEKLNVNESSLTAPPNIENSDRYKDQGLGPLEQSQTIFDDYLMQIEKPRMLDLDPLEEFFGSSALGNGPNLFSKTVNNIESEWEEFVDLNYSNAEEFVFSQAATVANEPIDDQRDGNKEQCNVALPLEPNSRIKPKPKSATGEDPKVDIHEKDSLEMEGDTQVEITEDALNGESGNVQFTVGKRAETHLPKTLSIGEPVVSNCQTNGLPVDHQIDNGASGMDIDPLEVASDVDSDDNEDAPIVFSGIPSDDDFESVDLAEDTRAEECNLSSGKDVATTFNASSTNRLNQILHTETEMDVAVYTLESDCTYQSEDEQRVSTGKTVNEECESIDFTDGDEKKNIEAVNTNDVLPPVIQDKEISAVDCEENQNLEPNLKCAPALPTNPQIEIDAQVGSKLDIPQSETGTTVGEVQKYPKEYSAQERVVVDSNGGSFSKEDQTVYQPNDKNIESLTPPAESQESDEDQIVSSGKTIVDETESNDLTDGNQNEECSKMDVLNHETTNTKCKDLAPSPTAESADTLHENDISQLENDKLISQDNLISCNERMDETISESETASIDMDFQSDTNSPKKIHTQSRNTAPKKLIAKLPSSNSFSSDEETASICLGSEPKSPSEVRLEITDTPTKYNILTEIYKVTPEQTSKKRDFSSIEGLVSSNRVAVEELSTRIRKLNGTLDEAENYIMNCFKKSSPEPAFKKQKTQ